MCAPGGRPNPTGQCSPGRFPPRCGPPSKASLTAMERPDVLVLGAGGTLGEAWLRGLLGGIEAQSTLDFRECEYFVGTSAGSIVAAALAAGRRPEAGERVAREGAEA